MATLDEIFKNKNPKTPTSTITSKEPGKPETTAPITKTELTTPSKKVEVPKEPVVLLKHDAEPPKSPPSQTKEGEFDYSPELPESKHIVLIYGLKGSGKTSLAFSFPGTHACISFDKKSTSIKENLSEADKKRITIFSGIKHYNKSSPETWLISSSLSWKYLQGLVTSGILKEIKERPDWLVVDGGEVFEEMAEMVMRYNNQLQPFQGVTNRNIWKERRMYIDQFFNMCLDLSKKGIIWTSYVTQTTIYDAGSVIVSRDIPKWIDIVERQTDTVIRNERDTDKNRQTFYATVETSKWKAIPCSPRTDITGTGISKLAKGEL